MCYYKAQNFSPREDIKIGQFHRTLEEMGIKRANETAVINGFAYSDILCIIPNQDKSNFDIVEMEWGFLPVYIASREHADKMRNGYKDLEKGFRPPLTMLNAKGEEMLNAGKVFRDAALKRRCLVLSSGFYEWRHIHGVNKKTGQPLKTADKFPYHIGLKAQDHFYMAGIYQPFVDKSTGEVKNTVAVITTDANKVMRQIHNSKNRMPTILPDELAYRWIFDQLTEDDIRSLANYQIDSGEMEACTISKEFRASLSPAEPFIYEAVPALEY